MDDKADIQELLVLAVQDGDAEEVRQALALGADPNARRRGVGRRVDNPPLYWAAFGGRLEIARILLEGGARVAAELAFEDTSMHAAAENADLPMLELLLRWDGRSALDSFDYVYRTPLMCAIDSGSVEAVRLLIEAGSDIEAQDVEHIGDTALFRAAGKGTPEMVRLILAAGADVQGQCWMWRTAMDEARDRTDAARDAIIALLENPSAHRSKLYSNRKAKRRKHHDASHSAAQSLKGEH